MQIAKITKRIIKEFADSILPLVFWVTLIFSFDEPYVAVLTILCALIHECGHLLAQGLFKSNPSLHAKIYGFRIKDSNITSYKSRIITAMAGPVTNLTVFFALLFFGFAKQEYLFTFACINLATALSNLLPIEGYDGYVALFEAFSFYEKPRLLSLLYQQVNLQTRKLLQYSLFPC